MKSVKPNSRGLRAKSLFPKKILETDSSLLNALEEGSEVLQNITDQFATLMPRFRIFFSWEQERTTLPLGDSYNGIPQNLGLGPLRAGSQLAEDER